MKVAVIDDEDGPREAMRDLLAAEGIEAVGFRDPELFLRKLMDGAGLGFDAIVVDDAMLGISSFQVGGFFSKTPMLGQIPVVVASSVRGHDPIARVWALLQGAAGYAKKPETAREMSEVLALFGNAFAARREAERIALSTGSASSAPSLARL